MHRTYRSLEESTLSSKILVLIPLKPDCPAPRTGFDRKTGLRFLFRRVSFTPRVRHVGKLTLTSCTFVENHSIVEPMSSRLQPRRTVKTVLNYYEDAQESEDDHDSNIDHGYSAPNQRRGKTKLEQDGFETKQTRRRRSGKLSKLPAMPLDVMYEVRGPSLGHGLCLPLWSPRSSRSSTLGTC